MEKLKPLEELCQPDVRYRNRIDLNLTTGEASETTIQSLYSVIEPITLSEKVPDEVRSHFEIARNLALYSWFVYSFNVVTAMQAYASLELALKQKTGKSRVKFKKTLDSTFEGRLLSSPVGPPMKLAQVISEPRNDLAHGTTTMHGQGIAVLAICAELINELFP